MILFQKKKNICEGEILKSNNISFPFSPAYRSVVEERVCSRDKADSYHMGRSFAQVKAHCESLLDKLEDSNFGRPIEVLNAEIDKMIAEWN